MKGGRFVSGENISFVCCALKRFLCCEATIKTREFKLHKLETSPQTKVTLTKQDATLYYRQMITIRWLETAAEKFFKQKLIRGFCHLQTGQEACAVGMKASMRKKDSLITGYRVHGWSYLMGLDILEILGELLGKQDGSSKGKGGSMHMYGKYFYGGNGIVGAQVPLGAGIAFAAQYLTTGVVCVIIFGDGAAKQGQVYEAFNMAKLWKLPCVLVCENNCQALSLSNSTDTAAGFTMLDVTEFYTRGDYIPGIWVDGTDILAVREASRFAINHCVTGQGPILLELSTLDENLLNNTWTSDKKNATKLSEDPIISFKERILLADLITQEELKSIDENVIKEVSQAAMKAKMGRNTDLHELMTDVYTLCLESNIRNVKP